MVNEAKVLALFDAMNAALRESSTTQDANGSEMVSAVFTMTRVIIQASLNLGESPANLRHAVQLLLLECTDQKGN